MLTIEQVCQRLPHTTPAMVYRWKGCPRYRTGKRYLYMWAEVLDYLRDRPTNAPPRPAQPPRVPPSARVGEVFSMPHRAGSLFTPSQGTFEAAPSGQAGQNESTRGAALPTRPRA
jgi:hypothetical protein